MAENEAPEEAKTTIDSLVDVLKARGKMDLNSISLSLGVSPKVVETWAKVLEGGGIVKINYELGKMFVELLQLGTEELGAVEKRIEEEKSVVEGELTSQSITLDKFSDAIKNINVNIEALEKRYRAELPAMEGLLSQINKFEEVAGTSTKKIGDMAKKAEDTYNSINKRFEDLNKRLDALGYTSFERTIEEGNAKAATALKETGEAREAIKAIEASNAEAFRAMLKNIEAQAEELKKRALQRNSDIINQLKTSSSALEAVANSVREHSNEIKTVNSELADFKAHRAGAMRSLNMEKAEFNDVYAKMHALMVDSQNRIGSTAKELMDKVNVLKSSFGDAAALYDKLNGLKDEADAISKQIEGSKGEISNLSSQLRALSAPSKMALSEKIAKAKNLIAKSKKSKSKIGNINKNINELSKKF